MVSWRSDRQIEITVLQVKLARAGIRYGIPPFYVVIHAHARVPLCNGINFTVLGFLYPRTVRAIIRWNERIFDLQFYLTAVCTEVLWQEQLHAGIIDQKFHFGGQSLSIN